MTRMLVAICIALAFLLAGMVVHATPLDGLHGGRLKIPGGVTRNFKEKFKGGERACVIVIGDHEPVVRLELQVEDAKGNLIGEDKSGGDLCSVIWYPPRDGEYTIRVTVPHIGGDQDFNLLYIALK